MLELNTLGSFSITVLLLMLTPGPNMAFVMTHGVAYGFKGGVAAALGIFATDVVFTSLTAAGITAVLAAWPPAFDIIRYAGALYLLYMVYKALQPPQASDGTVKPHTSLPSVFLRSMLNSMLNPKALLFYMVFLPQFVDPDKGFIGQQLLILGAVLAAISLVFHVLLGQFGSSTRQLLSHHSCAAKFQQYGLAALLLLLAIRLIVMTRPS